MMKVLGFGALLWDKIKGNLYIGGAVFNVIAHCRQMGGNSYLMSCVGKDKLGEKAQRVLEKKGVKADFIKKVNHPTCIVEVSIDQNGSPLYSLDNPTSWDFINTSYSDIKLINEIKFDFFCFGTIEQRGKINSGTIKSIFENCSFENIFFDVNLRMDYFNENQIGYSLEKCNILKLNKAEFKRLNKAFGFKENGYEKTLTKLGRTFNIKTICLTLGNSGAYAYSGGDLVHCPGFRVDVKNTVGSGDAFAAGFITKIYQGEPLQEACDYACRIGAFVASVERAVPDYNLENIDNLLDLN